MVYVSHAGNGTEVSPLVVAELSYRVADSIVKERGFSQLAAAWGLESTAMCCMANLRFLFIQTENVRDT